MVALLLATAIIHPMQDVSQDRLRATVFVDAHAPNGPDPGVSPAWVELADSNGGMVPFTGYRLDPDGG